MKQRRICVMRKAILCYTQKLTAQTNLHNFFSVVEFKGNRYAWKIFCHFFYKGDNFCDFLFVFLHTQKSISSKKKEFAPTGSSSLLLVQAPFIWKKKKKTQKIKQTMSSMKVYLFPLIIHFQGKQLLQNCSFYFCEKRSA